MSFMTRGKQVIPTANVLPRIGVLDPEPARATIREVFIRHVIGGKNLSRRGSADRVARQGGDTRCGAGRGRAARGRDRERARRRGCPRDRHRRRDDGRLLRRAARPEEAALRREVVEVAWRGRTVEGDLGVRWNAVGVVDAAVVERLVDPAEEPALRAAAERRAADPAYLAAGGAIPQPMSHSPAWPRRSRFVATPVRTS